MSPEQITEQLDEIISNIADAHILIYRLQKELTEAARKAGDGAVIYEDIAEDAGLEFAARALRSMEKDLARRADKFLPAHFERLRTEEVDPDRLREDRDERQRLAKEWGE